MHTTSYYIVSYNIAFRERFQKPEIPKFPYYMREWAEAWRDIDEE
jgi:hypothetical protein